MKLIYKIRLWLLNDYHQHNTVSVAKDLIYYDEFKLMLYFISITPDFHNYIIPIIRYSIYHGHSNMTKMLLNRCSNDDLIKHTIDGCILEEIYLSGHQEYIKYTQIRGVCIPEQILIYILVGLDYNMLSSMFKPIPYLLHRGCIAGNVNLVKMCLDNNVNELWDGYTPLYYAINGRSPNLDIIKLLISNGAIVQQCNVDQAIRTRLDQDIVNFLQSVL
jgi:hypothetical protein